VARGVNFARATRGSNFDTLARVTSGYDGEKLLHVNRNIPPA
jgi:hypothetical protein